MLRREEPSRNFDNLGDLVEAYENVAKDKCIFSLNNVGQVIQKLISSFYAHPFTKSPINRIDKKQVSIILSETDKYGRPMIGSIGIFNNLEMGKQNVTITQYLEIIY